MRKLILGVATVFTMSIAGISAFAGGMQAAGSWTGKHRLFPLGP